MCNKELLNALKRVLRYVKGTLNLNLIFCSENESPVFQGFVDADWGGDLKDRKSTSGYLFKIFGCTVVWCSRKQNCVTLSSTEAEYIALAEAVTEATWIYNLLQDLNLPDIFCEQVVLFEDNQGAIKAAKTSETSKRLKHVDIKYHYVREKVENGNIKIEYVHSENQIADGLTKALNKTKFEKFKCGLKLESV